MSCQIPYRRDFPNGRVGRTWGGITYQIEGVRTLTRVVCVVKDSTGTVALTLDSDDSGVTLTDGTAGSWEFTINAIPEVSLTAGHYSYETTLTCSDGTILDWFFGQWEIKN
jgi:hypothetical protein